MEKFYIQPTIKSAPLRVLLFLVCWLILFILSELFGVFFLQKYFPSFIDLPYAGRVLTLSFTFLLIAVFRKYIDKRPVFRRWFTLKKFKFDFFWGTLVGAGLLALGTFILTTLGYIEVFPGELTSVELVRYIIFFIVAALIEELVFRGYILDNLLEEMHWLATLFISSILFMLMHIQIFSLAEPTVPVINLFLAGFFLGIPFVFTRNLWFPLGLHFAWNFFQGPIFGFQVSGVATKSFLKQEVLKTDILSGGDFGFEGSVLATILILTTSIILYIIYNRKASYENN